MNKAKISIVRCESYNSDLVFQSVLKALDLIGGISAYIKPQSRVLVKPNLLMAKEPEFGIDTHPEVVRAVVKLLKQIKCKVFIGDGPSVWGGEAENVEQVYERSGMKRVSEEEAVELVTFEKRRWRGNFPLAAWLDNCDYLVNVPKFKTHELTTLTAAIKNNYGLVSGTYKTELHKKYFETDKFAKIVVDVFQEARPALTVIDGIVAMEGDGPATSGKLRDLGLLFAGADCVALDSVLAVVMGLKPSDILTTKEAARRGLGISDIGSMEISGEKLKDVISPFQLPASSMRSKIPQPIINLVKKFIRYRPEINHKACVNCGACIEACPNKIISRKHGRIVIDYSRCISCFCCQEACPNSAIQVKKSVLARIMGL